MRQWLHLGTGPGRGRAPPQQFLQHYLPTQLYLVLTTSLHDRGAVASYVTK